MDWRSKIYWISNGILFTGLKGGWPNLSNWRLWRQWSKEESRKLEFREHPWATWTDFWVYLTTSPGSPLWILLLSIWIKSIFYKKGLHKNGRPLNLHKICTGIYYKIWDFKTSQIVFLRGSLQNVEWYITFFSYKSSNNAWKTTNNSKLAITTFNIWNWVLLVFFW